MACTEALYRDPGRDWTVEALAAESNISRSVFADRFQTVVGTAPLRYVTELRMQLASQWLIHQSLSIEAVAERLGYASQAAFSRAYKRVSASFTVEGTSGQKQRQLPEPSNTRGGAVVGTGLHACPCYRGLAQGRADTDGVTGLSRTCQGGSSA
ncbi:helix-turn-helix transcriptional regulator [Stenotrophomonas sp.]|uniref:helix-turn-helix transcriptional regulator n=1 Tax=Stenotrophomonas sp. TaxID=69392 RepID=UPI00289A639F|nr:helix-turn-helix transcriptional regulator [Stenotrophomonas sp.]